MLMGYLELLRGLSMKIKINFELSDNKFEEIECDIVSDNIFIWEIISDINNAKLKYLYDSLLDGIYWSVIWQRRIIHEGSKDDMMIKLKYNIKKIMNF